MTDINQTDWSETDASNNSTPPNGWPSGTMLPSQVEPAARAIRGAVKRFYDHINAAITSGGAANVQTLAYSIAPAAYVSGDRYTFIAGFTNTGAATLNVNALGAKNINIGSTALIGGEIISGQAVDVAYDGTQFQLLNPSVQAGSWTPTLTGSSTAGTPTYTAQVGSYERNGRQVTARFRIVTSALGGSPAGNMRIGGLPFAAANVASDQGQCYISQITGVTLSAGYTMIAGVVVENTSVILLSQSGSASTNATLNAATAFAAATLIAGACTYRAS